MRVPAFVVLALALLVAACGGDSSGSSASGGSTATGSSTATASSNGTTCSLRSRQDFALATLNEWYLFPETLPASLDPTPFATVTDYIDALTATARAQKRDRYFTYITSISEEDAYYASGSSAGFGIRLANDVVPGRVFVVEAFEGAPALAAGIDRGDEITAIGNDSSTLRNVSDIIAAEGAAGVITAIGPTTAGTTRTLRVTGTSGTRTLTVTKANYSLTPVSARYGSRIIDDGGRRIGYINLRTFITMGDAQLRTAFANFRAQGITLFIVDLRYNGGGLVASAEVLGDLLGGNRASTDVFSQTTYRPEKSGNNGIHRFARPSQSVSPVRIVFIGTGATASASELVINAFTPFLGKNVALVGANTYGKPVGQVAIDKAACDDRIRVVAFSTKNAANSDAYFDGLAATVGTSCSAADDFAHPLGDAAEASIRQALNFLGGVSCTPITAGEQTAQSFGGGQRLLLTPASPTLQQRDVPGLF